VKRLRYILSVLVLTALIAWIALCVAGAFLGAERARGMFNSPPVGVLWGLLAVLLAVGLFAWGAMIRSPGLLAMHLGALLVLAGGIWGSDLAHAVRGRVSGKPKRPRAEMLMFPRQAPGVLYKGLWSTADPEEPCVVGELPFHLKLHRAWVEYYESEETRWEMLAVVFDRSGESRRQKELDAAPGVPNSLDACGIVIEVIEYRPGDRAVKLGLARGDRAVQGWVRSGPGKPFERLSLASVYPSEDAWRKDGRPEVLLAPPARVVKDYRADLSVLSSEGKQLARKTIEVNSPLHHGGYHFYLSRFDAAGEYLLLDVRSSDGLIWVCIGFALILIGCVLRLWVRPAWNRVKAVRALHRGTDGGEH
jgi:hypothetical protein